MKPHRFSETCQVLAVLSFGLSLVGCAWYQSRVAIGEELLSAAGFHRYYPQDAEEQTSDDRGHRVTLVDTRQELSTRAS